MKPILEVERISKKFLIGHQHLPYLSFRDKLTGLFKPETTKEEFMALRDVSFQVMPGESVGIIGRNGAGKSTLLKILSRITPPSSGHINVRGRIASLLEVGTGFHQELTGRENVFMNGSILGMKNAEIKARFDEIVDFSGTEKFLDTPLKHYSSGMQLRLAFAVAAHLDPEILIIDEVLAVGDAEFQKKCLGKMEDVSKSGRTILFVSHNLAAVENLCRRVVLLNQGVMVKEGTASDIIRHYQNLFYSESVNRFVHNSEIKESAYFSSIYVDIKGEQPFLKLDIVCDVVSMHHHKDLFFAFDISNSLGLTIMQAIPKLQPFIQYSTSPQRFEVEIELPALIPDTYRISAWLGPHNTETVCWFKEVVGFEINTSPSLGRNYPHSHNNGFLVPPSRIKYGKTVD